MKGRISGSVFIGILVMLAISGCGTQPTPVKPTPTAALSSKGIQVGERIIAEGRVMPVKSADLAFNAAGVVGEILVDEGDAVKKEQPLVRLDAKRQTAAVAQAESALARAKAGQARAQAVLAKAQAGLAQLKAGPRPEEVAAASAAVTIAEAELARVQAGADQAQLIAARSAMEKAARALQQAQYAYDHGSGASGSPEALRLEQASIDYEAAKAQYEQLALLPRDVDLQVAKARLTQAQASLAQVRAGARPEAIKAAEADVAAAEADLSAAAGDVASAEASLAQARAALAEMELRAPFDGVVVTLNVRVGQVAPMGGLAVRMADLSAWQIETTDLTELNIVKVSQGLPVSMTFDAIPELELSGRVARIRPYGESKQGDIVYAVVIAPDKQDPRLRWNMTAKVSMEVQ